MAVSVGRGVGVLVTVGARVGVFTAFTVTCSNTNCAAVAEGEAAGRKTTSSKEIVLAMKMVNINRNRKPEQPLKDGRSLLAG